MAFAKIVGLLVTPLTPSWSINRRSPPPVMRCRLMLSSQTDWPRWLSARSGLISRAVSVICRIRDQKSKRCTRFATRIIGVLALESFRLKGVLSIQLGGNQIDVLVDAGQPKRRWHHRRCPRANLE